VVISSSFERALIQEFEIPGGQFRRCRRHQFRRSTPHKAALKGPLWPQDLVITDVSDEIFNQSDKRKILWKRRQMTVSNHKTKMCKWLNKWIVPLLVAFIMLAAIAIAALVSFAIPLLR
jgi:hypothetical protein